MYNLLMEVDNIIVAIFKHIYLHRLHIEYIEPADTNPRMCVCTYTSMSQKISIFKQKLIVVTSLL